MMLNDETKKSVAAEVYFRRTQSATSREDVDTGEGERTCSGCYNKMDSRPNLIWKAMIIKIKTAMAVKNCGLGVSISPDWRL
ncbi:unnamed protein product [Linum trigynum]|uniref:Uncharacterized protein n=1 Tax=Linum trigynum TaxID=586398 RepID=A0AAV2FPV5_9ROSI